MRIRLTMAILAVWMALPNASLMATEGSGPRRVVDPSSTRWQAPEVRLRAESGEAIEFRTQNGRTVRGQAASRLTVRRLVLRRNGALTDPVARTLNVEVSGLAIPPAGLTATLVVRTQRAAVPAREDDACGLVVWQESRSLPSAPRMTQAGGSLAFRLAFGATVQAGAEAIETPTDYMRYELTVLDNGQPAAGPVLLVSQDYAFLLENEWVVRLGSRMPGGGAAGPQELAQYYTDMTPFGRDPAAALPRAEITSHAGEELVPAMLDALRLQMEGWGFGWSEAWTPYRGGRDAGRLSVALSDGQTWYHGPAPLAGMAGMSIRVSGAELVHYDNLTDGLTSTFHHELFHNLQRSLVQSLAGHGEVAGREDAWAFFSEGTAVLASSVAQETVQFAPGGAERAFLSRARRYVGGSGFAGDLNTRYADMTAYHAALYWRFLYEQCGGLQDPAAGMGLIRRALEALYSGDIVDITASTDLVGSLAAILDQALASPEGAACPFRTYADSLAAFSRALYALGLEGGRCAQPGSPVGCWLYDPSGAYGAPPVSRLAHAGGVTTFDASRQPHPAGVRSSYGLDLVEIELGPGANGKPLTVEVSGDSAGQAQFRVQAWPVHDEGKGSSWQRPRVAVGPAVVLEPEDGTGRLVYSIGEVDTGRFNRLALIITRMDRAEAADPIGAYTVVVDSGDRSQS